MLSLKRALIFLLLCHKSAILCDCDGNRTMEVISLPLQPYLGMQCFKTSIIFACVPDHLNQVVWGGQQSTIDKQANEEM